MTEKRTELVFILDRSGSMAGLEDDTIGGFNAMLRKQKKIDGPCQITTVLFSDHSVLLHDRIDIQAVTPISAEQYQVGGSTALLDAMGMTIEKISGVQKSTADEFRAAKVLFVIITDGQENASRRFSSAQIKSMISRQKEQYNWEFIFLGANIDAVETAGHFGISANRAVDYLADSKGTSLNFDALSAAACEFRAGNEISDKHLNRIRADKAKRSK